METLEDRLPNNSDGINPQNLIDVVIEARPHDETDRDLARRLALACVTIAESRR